MSEGRDNEARFAMVYAATRVPLLGYLARRSGDVEDAADLLAEVYAVAWRRIETVPDGDDARLYLYGVARNVLANHHRGKRRAHALVDRLRAELAAATAPRPATADDPAVRALHEALSRLDPVDRELVTLNVWEGLTPRRSRSSPTVRRDRSGSGSRGAGRRCAGTSRSVACASSPKRRAGSRPSTRIPDRDRLEDLHADA